MVLTYLHFRILKLPLDWLGLPHWVHTPRILPFPCHCGFPSRVPSRCTCQCAKASWMSPGLKMILFQLVSVIYHLDSFGSINLGESIVHWVCYKFYFGPSWANLIGREDSTCEIMILQYWWLCLSSLRSQNSRMFCMQFLNIDPRWLLPVFKVADVRCFQQVDLHLCRCCSNISEQNVPNGIVTHDTHNIIRLLYIINNVHVCLDTRKKTQWKLYPRCIPSIIQHM